MKGHSVSVDAKGHEHASEHDDFLLQVKTLKQAEQGAFAKVEEAKKQSAQIEAAAREKAVEIQAKAQEKAVEIKNEILAKGRESVEKEANGILNEAKKRAERIKGNELSDKEIASLAQEML